MMDDAHIFKSLADKIQQLAKIINDQDIWIAHLADLLLVDHMVARFMTISDICVDFQVSRQTVYRWRCGLGVRRPFPPPFRRRKTRGGRMANLWKRRDVEAWLSKVGGVRVCPDGPMPPRREKRTAPRYKFG